MNLIASHGNKGFEFVEDDLMSFDRRISSQRTPLSNEANNDSDPAKISTDIFIFAIDLTNPESFALSEMKVR